MKEVYLQTASFQMSGSRLSFLEQLKAAAKLGYTGVELAGQDYMNLDVKELKKYVDDLGLKVLGAHVTLDNATTILPALKTLGAEYMVIGSVNPLDCEEDIIAHAEALNHLGVHVHNEGIKFGYHDHNMEFYAPKGKMLLQVMIDNTDPNLVMFEYDVGWAAASGIDCLAFLEKNVSRIELIHANETDSVIGPRMLGRSPMVIPRDENGQPIYTPEEAEFHKKRKTCDCPMGKGIPQWTQIREAAKNVQHYIVERRYSYLPDPCDCFAEDLAFMKDL